MPRFEAVLLDFANTVVQFDRPQIEAIHVDLAAFLSRSFAPIDARALGEVMDEVCVMAPLSEDKRELTPLEQMRRVLQQAYDRFDVRTPRAGYFAEWAPPNFRTAPCLAVLAMLALVVLADFLLNVRLSPYFLDPWTLSDASFNFTERAIVALPMALLIIMGEIKNVSGSLRLSSHI